MSVPFRFCVYEMRLESYLVMDIMRISLLNYIKSLLQRFSNDTCQLSHLLSPQILNSGRNASVHLSCVGRELWIDTCDPDRTGLVRQTVTSSHKENEQWQWGHLDTLRTV